MFGRAAALIVGVALLAAAGCADDDTRAITEQTFEPVVAGTLTVATYLPAPGYWNGPDVDHLDGGFEWAIAEELADRFELELRVVERSFTDLVEGRLDGVDLALAQITITPERDEVVDFSVPYLHEDGGVLIADGEEEITDLRTARERTWVVVEDSVYEEFVVDVIDPPDPPLLVSDSVAAAEAVRRGDADAALMDLTTTLVEDGNGVTVTARIAMGEEIAAALPAGSPNLETVDAALRNLDSSGTLARLHADWLAPSFGTNPDTLPQIVTGET